MLKVEDAKKELSGKSYSDIQVETAWKWASRACASYENVLHAPVEEKVAIFIIAEEYGHEAIEHAALSGPNSVALVGEIQEVIASYFDLAVDQLNQLLGQKL